MKRIVILILAVMLLTIPFASMATENAPVANKDRIMQMSEIVENFLKEKGYKYEINNDNEAYSYFTLEFELESKFASCDVEVTVYDDLVTVLAYAKEMIADDRLDAAAAYMTRANWFNLYSHFNLNMEDGQAATYSFIPAEATLPGAKDIDTVLSSVIWTFEDFGDGLYDVAFEGADPKEAFDKAKAAYDEQFGSTESTEPAA